MFRISKSDDAFERHEDGDETDERHSASRDPAQSVASSALRWLRGSKRGDGSQTTDDATVPYEDADADGADDLELTEPLDVVALDVEDRDGRTDADAPRAEGAQVALRDDETRNVTTERQNTFDLYDDDDDIDDFDDLGDLDGVTPPEPLKRTSILADIDLDDLSSPEDHDDAVSLPVDLDPATIEPREISEPGGIVERQDVQDVDEPHETGRAAVSDDDRAIEETTEADEPATIATPILAEVDPPLVDVPLEAPSRKKPSASEVRASAAEHNVVPSASLDIGLALQPIPELQPDIGRRSVPPRKMVEVERDDTLPETVSDHVDDLDLSASEAGGDERGPEAADLDISALAVDSLELEPSAEDDGRDDDWHAHLADALGVIDGPDDDAAEHRDTEAEEGSLLSLDTDEPTLRRSGEPSSVLSLSKTLSDLAMSSEPEDAPGTTEEDDDTVPLPPLLPAVTARQKSSEVQPPSALPTDTTDFSPEQLSLGIVANLPRLRRFVAVQTGDELVADRLVQSTIEAALADPTALEPISDLGLALITLALRLRRDTHTDRLGPIHVPEAARAFETAVCSGLAGADQFEIRQFARAINALDEADRELLVLVALENFSYDQIAGMLRVPLERVMTDLCGARMRLRQALATDESGISVKIPAADAPHDHEIEINCYLDGELDGHHMADIDALVEYDEDAADRLLHYGIQGDLIRRLYAPLLNRPLSGSLLDAVAAAAKPARRGFRFGTRRSLIAGAFVILLCGGAVWPHVGPVLSAFVSDAMAISQATVDR